MNVNAAFANQLNTIHMSLKLLAVSILTEAGEEN